MTTALLASACLMIGIGAGLRAFTAPAVVAWAAYLGCVDLSPTTLAFVSSPITVGILTAAALGEFVGDLLPSAPPRTALPGLTARIVMGTASAACLIAAIGYPLPLAVVGGLGAVAGAFGGMYLRIGIAKRLTITDAYVAVPEDFLAIGMSIAAVCMLV